ncbi:MAG: TlpA family protein disulfide reductase [Alphaproteobacteria bacterium]|nr:TlpA family protein disulfide reductase [Alphaproteobacteria bacterium]
MSVRNPLILLLALGGLGIGYVLLSALGGPDPSGTGDLRALARGDMVKFQPTPDRPPAPEVRFLDAAGSERTLADFRGRVVLVNLWATWCAPCIEEMPALDRLQAELGGPDFEVVAISLDQAGPAEALPFLERLEVKALTPYFDRTMKTGLAFDAPGMPVSVLIDRDGREVGRVLGKADWASDDAKALIAHVIKNG